MRDIGKLRASGCRVLVRRGNGASKRWSLISWDWKPVGAILMAFIPGIERTGLLQMLTCIVDFLFNLRNSGSGI